MSGEVTLRPLVLEDAEEMSAVLADPSLYVFTGGQPPTAQELRRRYEVQLRGLSPDGTERWINRGIVVDGALVGYAQATVPLAGGPAEIAWVVGAPWQGRGLAGAGARLLVSALRGEGVGDLVAHIHPDHLASQHVARRLGMRPTDVVVDGEVRWVGTTAVTRPPKRQAAPRTSGARKQLSGCG